MQRYGILIFWLALTSVLSQPTTTPVPNGSNQTSDFGVETLKLESEIELHLKYFKLDSIDKLKKEHVSELLNDFEYEYESLNNDAKKVFDEYVQLKFEGLENRTYWNFDNLYDFIEESKYARNLSEEDLSNLKDSIENAVLHTKTDRAVFNLIREAMESVLKNKRVNCTAELKKHLESYYLLTCDGQDLNKKVENSEIKQLEAEVEAAKVSKYLNLTKETELSQSHVRQFLLKFWNLTSLNDHEKKVVDEFAKVQFECFKGHTGCEFGFGNFGVFTYFKIYKPLNMTVRKELPNLTHLLDSGYLPSQDIEFKKLMGEAIEAIPTEKP